MNLEGQNVLTYHFGTRFLSYGISYSRIIISWIRGAGYFRLNTIILRVIWTISKILKVPEKRIRNAGRSRQLKLINVLFGRPNQHHCSRNCQLV